MKNKMSVAALVLGLCVIFSACQPPAMTGLADEDEAAIRRVLAESLAIGNAPEKDFTAYVRSYYAEDATILPSNMPAVSGQSKMVSFFEGFPPYEDFRAEILEIDGRGDLAFVRGTYSMKIMMPESDMAMEDTGKYIEIWKKQTDGGWKVYLDIFNSDLPLPASEMEPEK